MADAPSSWWRRFATAQWLPDSRKVVTQVMIVAVSVFLGGSLKGWWDRPRLVLTEIILDPRQKVCQEVYEIVQELDGFDLYRRVRDDFSLGRLNAADIQYIAWDDSEQVAEFLDELIKKTRQCESGLTDATEHIRDGSLVEEQRRALDSCVNGDVVDLADSAVFDAKLVDLQTLGARARKARTQLAACTQSERTGELDLEFRVTNSGRTDTQVPRFGCIRLVDGEEFVVLSYSEQGANDTREVPSGQERSFVYRIDVDKSRPEHLRELRSVVKRGHRVELDLQLGDCARPAVGKVETLRSSG